MYQFIRSVSFCWRLAVAVFVVVSVPGAAEVCQAPDSAGTVALPANCPYVNQGGTLDIVNGLPPGTTIEVDYQVDSFFDVFTEVGGSLGGQSISFDATMRMAMTGTGMLSGYTYAVDIPLAIVEHTAPRTAGKPVQQFECDLFQLAGQITGDPLFDLLRVVSGSDSGHPCPGITTLTQLSGGDWHVDSFFDVFFEVEFAGAPGGPLAGLSGVSTDTVRTQQGEPYPWEHCDVFNIVFSPAGEFLSGGGGGWNGDGAGPWYYYPNTDWWN